MRNPEEYVLAIEALEEATRAYPVHFEMWYTSKNEWCIRIKGKDFKHPDFITATHKALEHVINNIHS